MLKVGYPVLLTRPLTGTEEVQRKDDGRMYRLEARVHVSDSICQTIDLGVSAYHDPNNNG
jgi:hypothetical protein